MNSELNKRRFPPRPAVEPRLAPGAQPRGPAPGLASKPASRISREPDPYLQDQVFRDALRTASQPVQIDSGRLFGRRPRRAGLGVGLSVVALAAAVIAVGGGKWPTDGLDGLDGLLMSLRTRPQAAPAAQPTPATASSEIPRAARAPDAHAAERVVTTSAAVPVFERFGLRRPDLKPGDNLELVISWQPSDGIRRAGVMTAYLAPRDAGQGRTALVEGWAVFPGESSIPLALPPHISPGKYELETVWTLGGEARAERTLFTVAERPTAPSTESAALNPTQHALSQRPEPVAARFEPTPAPALEAPALPPPPAAVPAPVMVSTVTPTTSATTPSKTPEVAPPRPRVQAAEQLYTGG